MSLETAKKGRLSSKNEINKSVLNLESEPSCSNINAGMNMVDDSTNRQQDNSKTFYRNNKKELLLRYSEEQSKEIETLPQSSLTSSSSSSQLAIRSNKSNKIDDSYMKRIDYDDYDYSSTDKRITNDLIEFVPFVE